MRGGAEDRGAEGRGQTGGAEGKGKGQRVRRDGRSRGTDGRGKGGAEGKEWQTNEGRGLGMRGGAEGWYPYTPTSWLLHRWVVAFSMSSGPPSAVCIRWRRWQV